MTQRRLSCLSDTGYLALVSFDWITVIQEMLDSNPLILDVLLSATTSSKKQRSVEHFKNIVPECGLVYGIIMKRRFKDMSRIQRFISLALANERVHQKVTKFYINVAFTFYSPYKLTVVWKQSMQNILLNELNIFINDCGKSDTVKSLHLSLWVIRFLLWPVYLSIPINATGKG